MSCTEPQSIGGAFSSFPLRCHDRGKGKDPFSFCTSCPAQLQKESPSPGDSSRGVGCLLSSGKNRHVYSQYLELPFMRTLAHSPWITMLVHKIPFNSKHSRILTLHSAYTMIMQALAGLACCGYHVLLCNLSYKSQTANI